MKTLLYANRAKPKSISVISILLLAATGDITKLRCMHRECYIFADIMYNVLTDTKNTLQSRLMYGENKQMYRCGLLRDSRHCYNDLTYIVVTRELHDGAASAREDAVHFTPGVLDIIHETIHHAVVTRGPRTHQAFEDVHRWIHAGSTCVCVCVCVCVTGVWAGAGRGGVCCRR